MMSDIRFGSSVPAFQRVKFAGEDGPSEEYMKEARNLGFSNDDALDAYEKAEKRQAGETLEGSGNRIFQEGYNFLRKSGIQAKRIFSDLRRNKKE